MSQLEPIIGNTSICRRVKNGCRMTFFTDSFWSRVPSTGGNPTWWEFVFQQRPAVTGWAGLVFNGGDEIAPGVTDGSNLPSYATSSTVWSVGGINNLDPTYRTPLGFVPYSVKTCREIAFNGGAVSDGYDNPVIFQYQSADIATIYNGVNSVPSGTNWVSGKQMTFRVEYYQNPNGASMTLAVWGAGVTTTTVNFNTAGTAGIGFVDCTVTMPTISGASNFGIRVYPSGTPTNAQNYCHIGSCWYLGTPSAPTEGEQIDFCGYVGSTVLRFQNVSNAFLQAHLQAMRTEVVAIELGRNDVITSGENFQTSLLAFMNACAGAGGGSGGAMQFMLICPSDESEDSADIATAQGILNAVVASRGGVVGDTVFLNTFDTYATAEVLQAQGYLDTDNLHPSQKGTPALACHVNALIAGGAAMYDAINSQVTLIQTALTDATNWLSSASCVNGVLPALYPSSTSQSTPTDISPNGTINGTLEVLFNGVLTAPTSVTISAYKNGSSTPLSPAPTVTSGGVAGTYNYTLATTSSLGDKYAVVKSFVAGGNTYSLTDNFVVGYVPSIVDAYASGLDPATAVNAKVPIELTYTNGLPNVNGGGGDSSPSYNVEGNSYSTTDTGTT